MNNRFTFGEAMAFIDREQRREFWLHDAPQIAAVTILGLSVLASYAFLLWLAMR